jgi:hypothetical protein
VGIGRGDHETKGGGTFQRYGPQEFLHSVALIFPRSGHRACEVNRRAAAGARFSAAPGYGHNAGDISVPDQVSPPVRAMMATSQSTAAMGLPLLVPWSMNLPVKAPQASPAVRCSQWSWGSAGAVRVAAATSR